MLRPHGQEWSPEEPPGEGLRAMHLCLMDIHYFIYLLTRSYVNKCRVMLFLQQNELRIFPEERMRDPELAPAGGLSRPGQT